MWNDAYFTIVDDYLKRYNALTVRKNNLESEMAEINYQWQKRPNTGGAGGAMGRGKNPARKKRIATRKNGKKSGWRTSALNMLMFAVF